MDLNSDILAQISLTRRPEGFGEGVQGPQEAATSARSVCVSWGIVGRYGIAKIGSSSTGGDGLGCTKTPSH